jgi:hypothetical protein
MGSRSGETHEHSDDSPTDQYAGNPNTRSNSVHEQVAGYFKNEIAEEEDPRDQSKLLTGHSQFVVHCQSGEPNIDSINERNHEENKDERDDPRLQLAECSSLNLKCSEGRGGEGHKVA